MKKLAIFLTIAFVCISIAPAAFSQQWQPSGDNWIEKWWALDLVINTGGFATSAEIDYLAEGTDPNNTGRPDYTNESVSTRYGAGLTGRVSVDLPDNGGLLSWSVITLDTESTNNLYKSHGVPDNAPSVYRDNITWHGIILVLSPDDRETTMYPAHDDHAQIWLNGDKVYDNPLWTGGAKNATQPTTIELFKGENFLHFKCGESGGGDYVNLRFEESDADLKIAPTIDGQFLDVLTPVEPQGKMTTTWADIKRK